MPSVSRIVRRWFCLSSPSDETEAANEDIRLDQRVKGGPAPAPTVGATEHELTEEENKSARLEEENQRLKARADGFAEEKRKMEDDLRQTKELLQTREKDLADKEARIQQLEKTMRAKPAEPQSTTARIQELSARLAEKEKLLAERTAELSAAQAFLTRVDAASEKEVVGMVENLNTIISSISGALDYWDNLDPVPGAFTDELDTKQIRDNLGSSLFEQVTARNSVAVNLSIQMSLGYFIERITSGWGGGQAAGTLGEIYGMISTKESQTIASRWRTLTKRYIPLQERPQDEEVTADLARVLVIIRSFSDFSEAMESVGNDTGTEVKKFIEATLQLDNTIKTKIASSDMSVYIVRPGAIFDEERMVNEFGDKSKGGERPVVAGTTEVGLLQRSGNVEKVLRRPKVILEQDLVEPEGES